jgi:hypothetical protein
MGDTKNSPLCNLEKSIQKARSKKFVNLSDAGSQQLSATRKTCGWRYYLWLMQPTYFKAVHLDAIFVVPPKMWNEVFASIMTRNIPEARQPNALKAHGNWSGIASMEQEPRLCGRRGRLRNAE